MQSANEAVDRMDTDIELDDKHLDRRLFSLCVKSWQQHRAIAAMQAALRSAVPYRSVLPPGVRAQLAVPRELAVPFAPSGVWHQLLVTPDYAFKCSGVERVEQLDYDDLQQSLRRQLRRATEIKLQLQRVEAQGSHKHNSTSEPQVTLTAVR